MDRRQVLLGRVRGEVRRVAGVDASDEPLLGGRRAGRRVVAVVHVDPGRNLPLRLLEVVSAAAVEDGLLRVGWRRRAALREGTERGGKTGGRDRREEHRARPRHRPMTTGVPAGVILNRRRSTRLRTRMQPFEAACPIDQGSFVPWMAIGPPCVQPVSTFENAEMPIAPGPKGPPGSCGSNRWLT